MSDHERTITGPKRKAELTRDDLVRLVILLRLRVRALEREVERLQNGDSQNETTLF